MTAICTPRMIATCTQAVTAILHTSDDRYPQASDDNNLHTRHLHTSDDRYLHASDDNNLHTRHLHTSDDRYLEASDDNNLHTRYLHTSDDNYLQASDDNHLHTRYLHTSDDRYLQASDDNNLHTPSALLFFHAQFSNAFTCTEFPTRGLSNKCVLNSMCVCASRVLVCVYGCKHECYHVRCVRPHASKATHAGRGNIYKHNGCMRNGYMHKYCHIYIYI